MSETCCGYPAPCPVCKPKPATVTPHPAGCLCYICETQPTVTVKREVIERAVAAIASVAGAHSVDVWLASTLADLRAALGQEPNR